MAIKIRVTGDFKNLERFLSRVDNNAPFKALEAYGRKGVDALASNTPVDSGVTAASWDYEIRENANSVELVWTNSHVNQGVPIAIILQYGHGTGTGGYVAGRDYINPAIQPIFDEIAEGVWKVVTSA